MNNFHIRCFRQNYPNSNILLLLVASYSFNTFKAFWLGKKMVVGGGICVHIATYGNIDFNFLAKLKTWGTEILMYANKHVTWTALSQHKSNVLRVHINVLFPSTSLSKMNLTQCQCQESSVNIQVLAQGWSRPHKAPSVNFSQHIPPMSLKDNNNHVFVGQWLMTHRNFIHGSCVFSGYHDDQVKTKHMSGIEFPNLDHSGRGKGKKAEATQERSL